jgi:predicted DNA-binding transcriptional regulator AlpA
VATAAQASTGPTSEPDRLLDVDAAAQRLGVSKDWIYRDAHQLPFTVHQDRLLRFSTAGIARYIRSWQGV